MSTNLPSSPTSQQNNSQKIAAVHASSIIDDNVNKIMPPPPPSTPPPSPVTPSAEPFQKIQNINNKEKVAVVFATEALKEPNNINIQQNQQDEIKSAIAVAASKHDKPSLEVKQPSPEQDENIAVAVAASKDNVIEENSSNTQTCDNQKNKIIELEQQLNTEKETHERVIAEAEQVHERAIAEAEQVHKDAIAEAKQKHNNEIQTKDNAIAEAKKSHADSLQKQELEYKQEIETLNKNHQNEVLLQSKNHQNAIKLKDNIIEQANKNHEEQIEKINKQHNEQIFIKDNEIQKTKDTLKITKDTLEDTKDTLKKTKKKLDITQENFKKIEGDRRIVSSVQYKNLIIKFKEYVIYILNEIKDEKDIIKIIEETFIFKENYNIQKIKELDLLTYYKELPNALSSRERIKLLIIYILSTYECKEKYNNNNEIMGLEEYNISDDISDVTRIKKNIYVVCKFFNDFVLDIQSQNKKENIRYYKYVTYLLMSDLQMYYGIPEYFEEKINKKK